MKEEEVLRLILQSPDAAAVASSWVNLQWAKFGLMCVFVGILGVIIIGFVWDIWQSERRK